MKYDNSKVRRQDRLLLQEKAIELLKNGEYGVLSMLENDGAGYGVPLNFVWNGENSIYFHSAPEGHKLNCMLICNKVSFCIVGNTKVISNKFTTRYESIIIRGVMISDLPLEEQKYAVELIIDKYSPSDKEVGLKYAEKSLPRTHIMRLDITEISGKNKIIQ